VLVEVAFVVDVGVVDVMEVVEADFADIDLEGVVVVVADIDLMVVVVVGGIGDIVVGDEVVYIVIVVFFVSFLAFLVVCGKFAVVNDVNQY